MDQFNALNSYKNVQVSTADKGKLVILLYERAIENINFCINNMNYKNYDQVNKKLLNTIDIFDELIDSLDMKVGEISERLKSIYLFFTEMIRKANLKKEVEPLKEIIKIIDDLFKVWKAAVDEEASNEHLTEKPNRTDKGGLSITG